MCFVWCILDCNGRLFAFVSSSLSLVPYYIAFSLSLQFCQGWSDCGFASCFYDIFPIVQFNSIFVSCFFGIQLHVSLPSKSDKSRLHPRRLVIFQSHLMHNLSYWQLMHMCLFIEFDSTFHSIFYLFNDAMLFHDLSVSGVPRVKTLILE